MATILLSGAALAFGVYSAGATYLGGLQRDIDAVALVQADLVARLESYYRERDPWIKRIEQLESRCSEVRERLGVGGGGR